MFLQDLKNGGIVSAWDDAGKCRAVFDFIVVGENLTEEAFDDMLSLKFTYTLQLKVCFKSRLF